MNRGLIDFKKEIETELIEAKQIWLNSFTEKFIASSPIPGIAPYATGYFINQTNINIDNQNFKFNLNTRKSVTKLKTKFVMPTGRNTSVSYKRIFKINKPYAKIDITNIVYYNEQIESTGWGSTPPYRPFLKSKRYSSRKLYAFLKNKI